MLHRLVLVPLVALVLAAPSQAGLFRKTSKPDPAVHVPALIQVLKTDKDERARASAASDLHEYDGKVFPDILPALMEALANDPSSSVRREAAESIGKIRPITAQAGYALEQALANDKSTVVKITVRTALMKYRFLGVIGGPADLDTMQTAEPPLAAGTGTKGTPGRTVLRPTPAPVPVTGPVMPPTGPRLPEPSVAPPGTQGLAPKPQTGEPPLAEPTRPAPTLTSQPPTPIPVITIPPAPRDAVVPIPTGPSSNGPILPPPPKG